MRPMKESGIEWIGEIPEGWEVKSIGKIAKVTSSKRVFEEDYVNDGIPFYRSKEIVELSKGLETSTEIYISEDVYNLVNSKSEAPKAGDLLLTSIGTIGLTWICDGRTFYYKDGNITQIEANTSNNTSFIEYCFKSNMVFEQYNRLSAGSTILALTIVKIKKMVLTYPQLYEQQAIADYLDLKCEIIDSTIEKQKTVIEKLHSYKQSLITESVTKGLDPTVKMKSSGIGWIGDIPEGWEVCRIKNIVNFNPRYDEAFMDGTDVSFSPMEYIGQGNMSPIINTIEKVKNGYTYFANGDIVMAKVTPCFENDNIAIADKLINGVGFGSSELYVFRCTKVNKIFLFYFLQNNTFKKRCISSMYGTGGLKRVSSDFVNTYKLALPSIKEQKVIADYLDAKCAWIDNVIKGKQKLIDKLTDYKKSLIYECVTGKKEVTVNA